METKSKEKWKTPHTFVILVVIILIVAAGNIYCAGRRVYKI